MESIPQKNKLDSLLSELFPSYGTYLEKRIIDGANGCGEKYTPVFQGYVYAIRMGKTSYVKIGFSLNPKDRIKILQISSPFDLEFLATWAVPCQSIENKIHKEFKKIKKKGEWFNMKKEDIERLFVFMNEYKQEG